MSKSGGNQRYRGQSASFSCRATAPEIGRCRPARHACWIASVYRFAKRSRREHRVPRESIGPYDAELDGAVYPTFCDSGIAGHAPKGRAGATGTPYDPAPFAAARAGQRSTCGKIRSVSSHHCHRPESRTRVSSNKANRRNRRDALLHRPRSPYPCVNTMTRSDVFMRQLAYPIDMQYLFRTRPCLGQRNHSFCIIRLADRIGNRRDTPRTA
jgi:hypothetical protein